jgi:hypothetical protein
MASRTSYGVDLNKYPGLVADVEPEKKKRSNAAKGSYYKQRTVKWLEEKMGYQVAHLERMFWIRAREKERTPCPSCGASVETPRMFATKSDQFAADLLAVNDSSMIFVQVKFGSDQVAAARRAFAAFRFPPTALRWVAVWRERAREPEIIDCSADTAESLGPVRTPKKKQSIGRQETMF